MRAGETPPGETPPGETPPGETPPGETPPGETPPGETPPGETPPGETPPGETPHSRRSQRGPEKLFHQVRGSFDLAESPILEATPDNDKDADKRHDREIDRA